MSTGLQIIDLAALITSNCREEFPNIYRHVPTGELHLFLQEFLTRYSAPKGPPLAWGLLSIQEPELTNDQGLADYWARKGRMVTALYAGPYNQPEKK